MHGPPLVPTPRATPTRYQPALIQIPIHCQPTFRTILNPNLIHPTIFEARGKISCVADWTEKGLATDCMMSMIGGL